MKNCFRIIVALVSFMPLVLNAQSDCNGYRSMDKGATFTYEHYDGKSKLQSTTKATVTELAVVDGAVRATVHSVHTDAKSKEVTEADIIFTCKDGVITMDMSSLMTPEQAAQMKEMEMTIEQSDLTYPPILTEGMTLPDGKMTMTAKMEGFAMTMVSTVTERKVGATEVIETSAGSYNCVKLTQVHTSEVMGMKTQTTSAEWLAMGIGMVRSESYDAEGKLLSYSILTSITR